jgi:hypothetical protein
MRAGSPIDHRPRSAGRARFLLFVITLVAPVMAAGLDPGAAAAATFTTLFDFPGGDNGFAPVTPLAQGPDGGLYGMTGGGGSVGCAGNPKFCGTVFKLTTPQAPGTRWNWTVLHRFTGGSDGGVGCCSTIGPPVLGRDGSLFGAATFGGTTACSGRLAACGLAFKLTPSRSGEPWTETILYSFQGGSDGAAPENPLVEGADGAFYGTTAAGGDPGCNNSGGCGTFFKLTPPTAPGGAWKETVLYRETIAGSLPNAGLTQFHGAFYYTTLGNECGTVSRIAPKPGGWRNEVLLSFAKLSPLCPILSTFYGVLVEPGIIFGAVGFTVELEPAGGEVFALTRPRRPGVEWDIDILHEFPSNSTTDGSAPNGAIVAGKHGVLFGATLVGGSRDCGTVWQLTPPGGGSGRWTEKILHDFQGGVDGCGPASISPGMGGVLYGTALDGGSTDHGTVFEIVP